MAFTLVTGRAGSGKTSLCLNEIKSRLNDGPGMLYYLVPEQSNLEAEHELFERCDADGLINAAVLTFRRISHRVFSELGILNRQYINGAGKRIYLSSVVDELSDKLIYYRRQSRSASFTGDLAVLFSEFKKFAVSEAKIEKTVDNLRLKNPALAQKMSEISLLYNRYRTRIDCEYLDAEDDLTRLASVIGDSLLIRNSEFWIDGFDGFTEQEFGVIRELLKYAKNVTVCLCFDSSAPASPSLFVPVIEASEELLRLAAEENVVITKKNLPAFSLGASLKGGVGQTQTVEPGRSHIIGNGRPKTDKIDAFQSAGTWRDHTANAALLHLEDNLFRGYSTPHGGENDAIKLKECADCYEEAEYAAASIRELCRDKDFRYSDIAVICSDIDAYAPLIGPVFKRRGIKCFIDNKKSIDEHPLIRLILDLFLIIESGYAFEPVFSYLKTGLAGLTQDETDVLENYALSHGIRNNRWKSAFVYEASEDMNDLRTRFISPVLKFEESISNECDPGAFCASVYAFLTDCGALRTAGKILKSANRVSEGRAIFSEWKQIWDYLAEILEQIAASGETAKSERTSNNWPVYMMMFRAAVENYTVGTIPPSADEVIVGNVDRTRGRKVKALFLLGANEGVFPGIAKPASLLGDSDRNGLRANGLNVAKDTLSSSFDSQFRVYRTLTIPMRYLRITWPLTSPDGKAAKPSFIIRRLKRMYDFSENTNDDIFALRTDSADSSLEHLIRKIQGSRSGGFAATPSAITAGASVGASLEPQWSAVYDWFEKDANCSQRLLSVMPYFQYRDTQARLSNAATLTAPDGIGVSRLEKYAACPFSYLSEYLVKARPRREYKIEAPDLGTFIHSAIELTLRDIPGDWADISFDDCKMKSDAAVESLLEEDRIGIFTATHRNKYQKDRVKDITAWSAFAITRHITAGKYKPWRYEMRFNIKPETGLSPVTLRGIVDRVDIAKADGGAYVRVVDYKTGSRKIALNDIFNGLTLQLPIYLEAAMNAASGAVHENVYPGGLFYLETRQPFINAKKNGRAEERGDGGSSGVGGGDDNSAGGSDRSGSGGGIGGDRGGSGAGGENGSALLELLKMDGYAIGGEDDFARTYENDILENRNSKIIKGISVKKDGVYAARVFAPDLEEYGLIRRAVASSINRICEGMNDGIFDVSPYKKAGGSPCAYCLYQGACGIDAVKQNEVYRVIAKISDRSLLLSMAAGKPDRQSANAADDNQL